MKIVHWKRVKRSYSTTGPMVRAALDFVAKWGNFVNFGREFDALPREEQLQRAVEIFEDRKVLKAEFDMAVPDDGHCIHKFKITFAPKADGVSPTAMVNVERVAELRAQAKLYPRDASAYRGVRKLRSKAKAIDGAL